MKELVVISGKGGTGKTSIAASLAALVQKVVIADCDVDAADMHLLLSPQIQFKQNFSGGSIARILPGHCTACGKCEEICRFDAIYYDGPGNGMVDKTFRINPVQCDGCGVCAWFCAEHAIEFKPAINGEWYQSETRLGSMVHAKLGVAEENSGKLVTLVRNEAKKLAQQQQSDWLLIDGSPGIGCPVIASITDTDLVLIVAEPTRSGIHDLERVAKLTHQLNLKTFVCINKWDINPELSQQIEEKAQNVYLHFAGRIRYDPAFDAAQREQRTLIEFQHNGSADDIKKLWTNIINHKESR